MKKSPTRSSANKAKAKAMYLHQGPDHRAPKIAQGYDEAFRVGEAYRASLPDMMEATGPLRGGAVAIQQVGVSNFRMPLRIAAKRGAPVQVEASVSGTVSVAARQRGINMSRLVRTFYRKSETVFTPGTLAGILRAYRRELGSTEARLTLRFSYPMIQRSLRSGLEGYQYYKVAFDARCQADGAVRTFVEFDFVYSSACPCSAELAEHARDVRGVYSIPHNQRSKARLRVELAPGARVSLEDLRDLCVRALRTETQVMVKREDEQAFAELNGAHLKFVEDAARLLHSELVKERRFVDFQAACVHLESLHSHDAVSVICKGVKGGLSADFSDFQSLVC